MKTFSFKVDPLTGEEYYEVYLRGRHLLDDSLLTKMSCFTEEERLTLGVEGYVRAGVSTIDEQAQRCMEAYHRKTDDLERYIYLLSLLDRCEVLFYHVLTRNLADMVPIVYTPTVGQACLQMSHIARRFRGIYITAENIRNIDRIFRSVSRPVINLIVATDGERILGLGDLGSDGMGIPVGKINLYVAGGGLHPTCCLPISLDVGTNNEALLRDPLYLGIRKPRLEGQAYFDFIERFVLGVRRNFPGALLQWEDFAKHKAFPLLERYRDRIPSFNDDIQGTGATALAALLTAMRIQGKRFREQRFAIVGMGQAGVGISKCLRTALLGEGVNPADIGRHIFAVDRDGLLMEGMPGIEAPQEPFVQSRDAVASWKLANPNVVGLMDVIRNARTTALIGVSANPGLFGREVLKAMSENSERPVIFALSNPTSKSECTLEEALAGTSGRVLYASGSPFAPVDFGGRRREASQCNNMFVFPGVGLGALVSTSPRVTDDMFTAASRILSEMVTSEQMERGLLLPELSEVREASARVAAAVAIQAREAEHGRLLSDDRFNDLVRKAQWIPHYTPYRPGRAPSPTPRLS
jgi:malate dehydrogenase (oxaloacetate-decarboxylating)